MNATPPNTAHRPRRRPPMPLRHKLMLALACEIVLAGFQQANLTSHPVGITIEVPAHPHHVVT